MAHISSQFLNNSDEDIFVGLEGQPDITTIIPNIKSDYAEEVIVQNNIMYYKYNNTNESAKRVEWCFKHNIPVWGYNSYEEFVEETQEIIIPVAESTYSKIGETYMQTPDLSSFNTDSTYYVTYDIDGIEDIPGRIDKIEQPQNWYDYENKNWANIVTVEEDAVTYWVWIPRYVYKTDSTTQTVDVKFVSGGEQRNVYKNSSGEVEVLNGYQLSDAFTFGNTGEEINLNGYWMSKYELSDSSVNAQKVQTSYNASSITITTSNPAGEYDIFINGIKVYNQVTLPYNIENLTVTSRQYDITLVSRTEGMIGKKKVLERLPDAIDLSKFNPECTYYVTYDEAGNEEIAGRIDRTSEPIRWYDYTNQRWANIVTIEEDAVTYWVYIPRYEYYTNSTLQNVDIRFIAKAKNVPTIGYTIPDAFSFNGEALSGYWISKYELSDSSLNAEQMQTSNTISSITVKTDSPSGDYDIYINGIKGYAGTLPHTFENVNMEAQYDITLVSKTSGIKGKKYVPSKELPSPIDLSGFNPECTYYVTYDEAGNEEIAGRIDEIEQPQNWYDYPNKKWANIKTVGNEKEAYWVWIPRYEYCIINSAYQNVEIKFIPKTKTVPTLGYKIPDAFSFNGEPIAGYWISKYELSR